MRNDASRSACWSNLLNTALSVIDLCRFFKSTWWWWLQYYLQLLLESVLHRLFLSMFCKHSSSRHKDVSFFTKTCYLHASKISCKWVKIYQGVLLFSQSCVVSQWCSWNYLKNLLKLSATFQYLLSRFAEFCFSINSNISLI